MKLLEPLTQETNHEHGDQLYEIVYNDPPETIIEEAPKIINFTQNNSLKVFKVSTIRTRSHGKGKAGNYELTFEELKKNIDDSGTNEVMLNTKDDSMSEQQSHRSFDFEENEEQLMESEGEIYENDEEYKTLRDPDDEDFPSAEALRKIPSKLINNGTLIYKGKRLMRMLSIFYNMSCKVCSMKRFRSINDLFNHYRSFHSDREPFVTCCSMELTKMPKIIWHFVKHIEPEAFKCNLCNYAVSRPKFLEIHQQTHLPESEKPLECDL